MLKREPTAFKLIESGNKRVQILPELQCRHVHLLCAVVYVHVFLECLLGFYPVVIIVVHFICRMTASTFRCSMVAMVYLELHVTDN